MADEEIAPDAWAAPSVISNAGSRWSGVQSIPRSVTRQFRPVSGLKTRGSTRPGRPCFVYVAAGTRGRMKVGITSDPDVRARHLRSRMVLVLSVVREAARDVEGLALTMLGRYNDAPGEWVTCTPEQAVSAVQAAYADVSRYRHTDPAITEDDARRHRIGLASNHERV